jgi:hypothetical protein
MIVIGADTHKSTHTLVACDGLTGRPVWAPIGSGRSRTFGTSRAGWSAS